MDRNFRQAPNPLSTETSGRINVECLSGDQETHDMHSFRGRHSLQGIARRVLGNVFWNAARGIRLQRFSTSCLIALAILGMLLAPDSPVTCAIADDSQPRPSLPWELLEVKGGRGGTDGQGGKESLVGQVWVEAVDGSMLFCDQLGHLHLLKKEEVFQRQPAPAELLETSEAEDEEKLKQRLEALLPKGFQILRTRHFVFCYWTSLDYAQWVSALYERLHNGFTNYWDNRGFKATDPQYPQIVLIFANQAEYERFAKVDMGVQPTGIIGYYHMLHNWVVMYDLTASGEFGDQGRSIAQVLSNPAAIPMVATIVHEATHQIMFNNGMQTRLADIPLWVSEGLAVYFEAPDLSSKQGWRGIGKINVLRYRRAKQYLTRRPADSLKTLIQDDTRFRDSDQSADAYAEAWALNYFLLKRYRKEYQQYLQFLSSKPAIESVSGPQRIADLETHLGKDLATVDQEFVKYLQKLR